MSYYDDFVKKRMINRIGNLKSLPKLYDISRRLSKVANQRLLELERNAINSQAYLRAKAMINEFLENPFIENKKNQHKVRFPSRKTFSAEEYKDLIRILNHFLSMETSKVGYAKKVIKKSEKKLSEKFKLKSKEDFNTFYDFMNLIKQEKDILEYIPSDVITLVFSENIKNPLSFSKNLKDLIIESRYKDYVNRIIDIVYKQHIDEDVYKIINDISTNKEDLINNLDAYASGDEVIINIINDLL